MDKYTVKRTDTADSLIHKIVLGIAEKFDTEYYVYQLTPYEW